MKRSPALLLVAALSMPLVGAPALTSCASVQAAERSAADVLLPVSEENKLGAQLAAQVENETKLHSDPQVQRYIQQLGQKLVARAKDKPEGIKFTFKVIDDDKTINAFALPGGHVYVYSGLMKAASDESELAGVMAHEISHVTRRHIAERLVTQLGLQTVLGLALGQNPSMLAQLAAQIAGTGTLLKFSRDQESDADTHGLIYMTSAGYDPMGMVRFFEKLQKGEGPGALVFLSDHPMPSDRIAALKQRIAQLKKKPTERNEDTYRDIKARV